MMSETSLKFFINESYLPMKGKMTSTLGTGFAVFSMFFGAGNVIFPLAIGLYAQSQNLWSIIGLLITAVAVPFLGLLAMTLFDGSYRSFFGRLGSVPGYLIEILILLIIGPFGAIPRCIVLAHSSLHVYLAHLDLPLFSLIACFVVLLCTWRRSAMLDILGYFLTPLMLVALAVIIVQGLFTMPPAPESEFSPFHVFLEGLKEGYYTMDLLGAFFFSSVVLICLKREIGVAETTHSGSLIRVAIRAGLIGMTLLSLVYIGFNFLASRASHSLATVPKEELLGHISYIVLGTKLGFISSIAVALACLTTAIALTAVFAEFVHEDLSKERVGWPLSLLITLVLSYFVSTWEFTGISNFLTPILIVCYPAFITLTLCNLAYKTSGFRPVKVPVLIVFLVALIAYFL